MLRTKTKKLCFASLLVFLFLNMFLLPALALDLPGNDNGIIPPNNGIVTLPAGQTPSDPTNPGTTTTPTTTPSTNSGTGTTTPTTTTSGTASGTGLVKCGNEGGTPCTFNDLFTMVGTVIDFILYTIVPALAAFGFVMAAIIMMTSNGDPGKFKQGKDAMFAIAIGLIIIYLAWFIVDSFVKFLMG